MSRGAPVLAIEWLVPRGAKSSQVLREQFRTFKAEYLMAAITFQTKTRRT